MRSSSSITRRAMFLSPDRSSRHIERRFYGNGNGHSGLFMFSVGWTRIIIMVGGGSHPPVAGGWPCLTQWTDTLKRTIDEHLGRKSLSYGSPKGRCISLFSHSLLISYVILPIPVLHCIYWLLSASIDYRLGFFDVCDTFCSRMDVLDGSLRRRNGCCVGREFHRYVTPFVPVAVPALEDFMEAFVVGPSFDDGEATAFTASPRHGVTLTLTDEMLFIMFSLLRSARFTHAP